MNARLFIFISTFALISCTSRPLQIDTSSSIYNPPNGELPRIKLKEVSIVNKAKKGVTKNTTLGSDSVFPIITETPTINTVEDDINRYFEQRTLISNSETTSLHIVIYKADAYWVWSSAAKVPLFGLLLAAADTEFGINIKISFEVEEHGKVVKTFQLEDVIIIESDASTEGAIKESYKKLIAKYRQTIFDELELEFVNRYI